MSDGTHMLFSLCCGRGAHLGSPGLTWAHLGSPGLLPAPLGHQDFRLEVEHSILLVMTMDMMMEMMMDMMMMMMMDMMMEMKAPCSLLPRRRTVEFASDLSMARDWMVWQRAKAIGSLTSQSSSPPIRV